MIEIKVRLERRTKGKAQLDIYEVMTVNYRSGPIMNTITIKSSTLDSELTTALARRVIE